MAREEGVVRFAVGFTADAVGVAAVWRIVGERLTPAAQRWQNLVFDQSLTLRECGREGARVPLGGRGKRSIAGV